ncbi:HIT domain-containing protein [Methylobrevis albus]|uniref:HIT domain-containing protein n=1 Tax=Methylobrevis albus TaxID=2793297 RepID=A0A931I5T0_9HYPH|nr:HIT domain-containing protein [Methylobrevis albus]MBH0239806.1 HIT domain-containing protein [Methylobrevis albus]
MSYDDQNIFAKILRGEIPCHKVFEDADTLVFMDIMPQSEGHALVVPKAPSRNLLDADPAVLGRTIAVAQKVAIAAKAAFAADGIVITQFNEAPAGQTVFHLHVHVIPRYEGAALRAHGGGAADHGKLAADAAKLKAALG